MNIDSSDIFSINMFLPYNLNSGLLGLSPIDLFSALELGSRPLSDHEASFTSRSRRATVGKVISSTSYTFGSIYDVHGILWNSFGPSAPPP